MRALPLAWWLLSAACNPPADTPWSITGGQDDVSVSSTDADHDGHDSLAFGGGDCDDSDRMVFPGAPEFCNERDDDCDGVVDEDPVDGETWYPDVDGDQAGDAYNGSTYCDRPYLVVADGTDCDDADYGVNPARVETCDDDIDTNCDGQKSESGCIGGRSLGSADAILVASMSATSIGSGIASLGDLDGDGSDDVALAASDSILIVDGPFDGITLLTDPTATWVDGDEAAVGSTLVALGDVDGDGFDDLVSADAWSSAEVEGGGIAFLLRGPLSGGGAIADADAVFTRRIAEARVGGSVAGGVDADMDGLPDLAIADSEGVWLVSGLAEGSVGLGSLDTPDRGRLLVEDAVVATVGDIDGDGLVDLAVGSRSATAEFEGQGMAWILSPPLVGDLDIDLDASARLHGGSQGEETGALVADGGDIDGDGYGDLLVGALYHPYGDASSAAVYVVSGPISGDWSLSDATGCLSLPGGFVDPDTLTGLGDVDGDGPGELAIGSTRVSLQGRYSGAVWVVRGPVSGRRLVAGPEDLRLIGEYPGARAGAAVQGADIDGDGLTDLLVGSDRKNIEGGSGAIYVFNGASLF